MGNLSHTGKIHKIAMIKFEDEPYSMGHNWWIILRILQNIMEDLSESTTQQIEFIEYLLQVKYLELEANQKLENKMASEFKVSPMTHGPYE